MDGADNTTSAKESTEKLAGTDSGDASSSSGSSGAGGDGVGVGGKKVPSWLNSKAWSRPAAKISADGARLSPRTPGKGGGVGSALPGNGGEEGGDGRSGVGDSGGMENVGAAMARARISSEAEGIGGGGGLEGKEKGGVGSGGDGDGTSGAGERAGKLGWHEMEEGSGRGSGAGGGREGDGAGGAGGGGEGSSGLNRPGRARAVTSPSSPPSTTTPTPPIGPLSPRPTAAASSSGASPPLSAPRTSPSLLPLTSSITAGLGFGSDLSSSSSVSGGGGAGGGGDRRPSLLEQLRAAAFAEPIVVAPVLHARAGGGGGGGVGSFTLATASAEDQAYERRLAQFYMEISQPRVNLGELRRLAMYGIPNEGSLRPVVWKLLLGLLPLVRDDWEAELERKRRQYDCFTAELIINPSKHTVDLTAAQGTPSKQQAQQQQGEQGDAGGKITLDSPLHGKTGPALWDKQDFGLPAVEAAGGAGRPEREALGGGVAGGGVAGGELRAHGEGGSGRAGGEEVLELHGSDVSSHDHPLNDKPTSVWRQYFQDSEIFEQIDRDVRRTHPEMLFFTRNDGSGLTPAQEAMRRLLLIFAKLNPGIRYVQGMNEVLAPIVYVFANDPDKAHAVHAEADAFFCFVDLLSDFRDFFCQQLDNSVVGIRSAISRLAEILRRHDEELWRNLEYVSKVNPQFYAFRWITLLLTQEFGFPQILRIWDALLACPEGPMDMLLRVCCAMLMCVRERLLAGDFTNNLKLLQRYPRIDIEIILRTAERLHT
ncbi:unnamed protein product [Closterium sp. NIES-65]|nr:unnamed protein product [Closterium sp. NIES-65]